MSLGRVRTILQDRINERDTPTLRLVVVDEAGNPITSLTTLTLAIHAGGTVLRARDDIMSSFSAGSVAIVLAQGDTAIVDTSCHEEVHVALIEWTWDSGNRRGSHEVWHYVRNVLLVPA